MKALAVKPNEKVKLTLLDIDKPQISDGEVLVKVLSVGIDGTDRELVHHEYGELPSNENHLIIGHESFGKVIETGNKVTSLKSGDYVVALVRRPDDCVNCQAGEYDMCLTGNYTERGIKKEHGFLTEYYKDKEKFLVKVPHELEHVGVLLEPFSISQKAIRQAFTIQKRMVWKPKTAVVMGTGTIGLLGAIALKLKGLEVYALDRSPLTNTKKEVFAQIGLNHINSQETPIKNLPKHLGKNIDFIFEATGSSNVAIESMQIIGNNGVVALSSVTNGEKMLEICADCLNQNLVLGNKLIFGTVNAGYQDFEQGLIDMKTLEKTYPGLLEKLITSRVAFDDYNEAFRLLDQKDQIKVVIELNKL